MLTQCPSGPCQVVTSAHSTHIGSAVRLKHAGKATSIDLCRLVCQETPSGEGCSSAIAPNELACQVQERLLVVVVGLRTDLVVLQVLLAVESDLLRLHLRQAVARQRDACRTY